MAQSKDDHWLRGIRRHQLVAAGEDPDTPENQAWIYGHSRLVPTDTYKPPVPKKAGPRDYKSREIRPEGPCGVYRAYDAEGNLLYVGITARGVWRARQHGYRSEWWLQMVRMEWEHFTDRNDALDRETELIAALNPLHNHVRPTPDKPRPRRLV